MELDAYEVLVDAFLAEDLELLGGEDGGFVQERERFQVVVVGLRGEDGLGLGL